MSGRRNNRGYDRGRSSYSQNADRLRGKLEMRNEPNDDQSFQDNKQLNRPPGLKGREIGLWYAQQHRLKAGSSQNNELKMLPGPNVSLPTEQIKKTRGIIENASVYLKSTSFNFRSEFQRHNEKDFIEILKSEAARLNESIHEGSETDEHLYEEFVNKAFTEEYVNMLESRQKLPAYQKKDEILELIKEHQIILIEGNTGCGKTTQVAQYILDDALNNKKGSRTRIICTQPRRIAATSIAERVAYERNEQLGVSVGYRIRLEKVVPRNCGSITFCTTGVLLKLLEIDPLLVNESHVIIDEIHERNSQVDICLALLKQIMQYRPTLKIILMSATLNAESFSQYFNNCPIVHIEGFSYPVQEFFLEDVLEETKYDNFRKKSTRKEPIWVQYKRQDQENKFDLIVGNYARSITGRYSPKTIENLMNPETENIDVDFIEHLIHHISYNKEQGAILVIVPGYSIISKLLEKLQKSPSFPSDKFIIYPLHSMLTGNDQRNIFIRPPERVRKIILSTPLAETSITIDDVVFVISAGKMKKPYFDFERNANVLEDHWITKANETQRKGRAGRVQEGICYHLYSRGRSSSLEPFEQPEILRIRLEEIVLTVKVLCIKQVKWFLSTLIDKPEEHVIVKSIELLQRLGALTDDEKLTPLGLHLAHLSIPPKIGKMLLFSSIFSCVDPISSIAAGLSFKSPFYSVMGKEESCDKAKCTFSNDSDQLAVANAVFQWKLQKNNQRKFCYENFLSHSTLVMLDRMKIQFCQSLYSSKFLHNFHYDSVDDNEHSSNGNLLRAVICGGLYPNIAYRSIKVSRYKRREMVKTVESKVKLLPSSVNCDKQIVYDPGYLVFHELNKFSGNLFINESTANVSPYAIILFGDRIETRNEEGTHYISVGDIVKFKCDRDTAKLLIDIRESFNELLEKKIVEPSPVEWSSEDGKLLRIIIELISSQNKKSSLNCDDDDNEDADE